MKKFSFRGASWLDPPIRLQSVPAICAKAFFMLAD
jgi:hypothetical protein